MALTLSVPGTNSASPIPPGTRRSVTKKVTFDTSYPTGGYPILPSAVGLLFFDHAVISGSTVAGRLASWDATNNKLLVFASGTTEVGNGVDIHTDSVIVTFSGV